MLPGMRKITPLHRPAYIVYSYEIFRNLVEKVPCQSSGIAPMGLQANSIMMNIDNLRYWSKTYRKLGPSLDLPRFAPIPRFPDLSPVPENPVRSSNDVWKFRLLLLSLYIENKVSSFSWKRKGSASDARTPDGVAAGGAAGPASWHNKNSMQIFICWEQIPKRELHEGSGNIDGNEPRHSRNGTFLLAPGPEISEFGSDRVSEGVRCTMAVATRELLPQLERLPEHSFLALAYDPHELAFPVAFKTRYVDNTLPCPKRVPNLPADDGNATF
ncbi:hypothetical protein K504DRAFT_503505 [Pleomassaria siparia CBS 279.74]|uniref:Uncharacterized protein n=1 Tax=Pleomassaria siparia CBS 279.74 TaxID=1314801 RepID=A0A6G1K723_9PLEO|nr:hypothetical protein K504DRAFT_503505 [Pleomassaria siparia CBS 279.74]